MMPLADACLCDRFNPWPSRHGCWQDVRCLLQLRESPLTLFACIWRTSLQDSEHWGLNKDLQKAVSGQKALLQQQEESSQSHSLHRSLGLRKSLDFSNLLSSKSSRGKKTAETGEAQNQGVARGVDTRQTSFMGLHQFATCDSPAGLFLTINSSICLSLTRG